MRSGSPTSSVARYDANPAKLQLIITELVRAIEARGFAVGGGSHSGDSHQPPGGRGRGSGRGGVEVVPLALSEALDGRTEGDYVQRVEPSVSGGRKMARLILRACQAPGSPAAPSPVEQF